MRNSNDSYTRARLDRFTQEKIEDNKTVNAIKETMATEVAFLTEPAIRDCLSTSDFSFDLRQRLMTVYVVVPLDKLDIAGKFFRLIVSCALSELLQPGRGKKRVTVIITSFTNTGRCPVSRTHTVWHAVFPFNYGLCFKTCLNFKSATQKAGRLCLRIQGYA
jgi:type IV secretory pathway TraG/TraD family ATPase VirD4